jgi:hypothetical protein
VKMRIEPPNDYPKGFQIAGGVNRSSSSMAGSTSRFALGVIPMAALPRFSYHRTSPARRSKRSRATRP